MIKFLDDEFAYLEKELEGNNNALSSLEKIKQVISEIDFQRQLCLRSFNDIVYIMDKRNEEQKRV